MLKKVTLCLALCALVATVAVAAPSNNADTDKATWADDIAPLLYENCVSCHRPGQVAPMSLLSYKEARPWAKSIRNAVSTRTMPPFFAESDHGHFKNDPRLTEDQIAKVSNWVAAGAPAGDLANAPEPPTFSSEWQIGEPDLVLTMEPFTVTDEMEDHYQWVKVTNTLDRDRWIKELEVRPTFMEGAHHNLTYIAPGDFTIEDIEGAGRLDMDYVSGWAPGVMPTRYEEGYGKLLPANSSVFFQMHYHKTPGPGTGGVDQTSVGINFYEDQPEDKLTTMWIIDPMIRIPPGDANYESQSSFTFPHDGVIFDFTPHMHLRGKAMKFTAIYPDGKEEVLLDVPNYDFNWQLTYTPQAPLEVPAGTKVILDAVYDNSVDNPDNPDPTVTVTFGEKTTDEMMIGFMHYSYADRAHQETMETHSVPEHLREGFERVRELREQQKAAKAQESTAGDDR